MRFETDGEYPEHWVYKTIGDVCTKLTSGGTPSRRRPDFYENGTVGWIKTKELKDGPISNSEEYITHSAIKNSSAKLLPPSTVLMAMYGATVGMLGVLEKEMACNQACCAMIFDSELAYYRYVFYLLLNERQRIKSLATGAAQQNLSGKQISQFEFLFPPVSEQKKIAKVLGDLDKKIQVNNQLNQTLEQMAQAIFKSWFVDFDPVKAKIAALEAGGSEDDALLAAMQAIAGSTLFATDAADADAPTQLARLQAEHPEQYATFRATAELFPSAMQESELGGIPEGWKVLPLSEMVELIGGGTPKRSEPAYWNGDICWFSVKDAPNDGNVFVIDTVEKITDVGLNGSSTKLLPLGTTIITARGTVGKLALTGVVTAMNQSCYGVIGIDGTGPYLNYLQMQEAVETLQRNTHGAVFDTITQATFGTVFQAQACISLRTNFENLVAPAFEMIKNNLQQIKALSELRDTLLPKLLSGELSVAEAE